MSFFSGHKMTAYLNMETGEWWEKCENGWRRVPTELETHNEKRLSLGMTEVKELPDENEVKRVDEEYRFALLNHTLCNLTGKSGCAGFNYQVGVVKFKETKYENQM